MDYKDYKTEYKKNNIFDYLEWRGDLTFAQSEFNDIDALILSVLSYLDLSGIRKDTPPSFREIAEHIRLLPEKRNLPNALMIMPDVLRFSEKAAATARFGDMKVADHVNLVDAEKEIQFSAVTFLLSDGTAFLSFRGTDSSLVGWKENFNMCFTTDGVPAQLEAAKYALAFAEKTDLPFRLGGHSKGGNLAVWAAACMPAPHRERILGVYNNDGPGFSEAFLNSAIYMSIREKIHSFVPESSIVGVLMEHDDYTTIRSSETSLLQHQPFSWLILGTHFLTKDTRSHSGKLFDKTINSWIRSMTPTEREEFVDTLYKVLVSSNAATVDDLDDINFKDLLNMDKTFRELDAGKQSQFLKNLGRLILSKGDDES